MLNVGYILLNCLSRSSRYSSYSPATLQDAATVLSCPLELDGKTPLLKTPHTLVMGYRETKLVLDWKLPFCWLAFIVAESGLQAAEEGRALTALPRCEPESYGNSWLAETGPLVQ